MSEHSKRKHIKYGKQNKFVSVLRNGFLVKVIKPQWRAYKWVEGKGYQPTGKISEISRNNIHY